MASKAGSEMARGLTRDRSSVPLRLSPRSVMRAQAARFPESSRLPASPAAHLAIGDLMAELVRAKEELLVAQRRLSELEAKVHEDALLPVLNRRGFDRELERGLAYVQRHGTSVSLIYIDIDDFKSINDIHGHATGDAALMHLANILLAKARRSDVIARLGGDEFAILLHFADEEAAVLKGDQLARVLASSPFECDGQKIFMSLTAGAIQLRGTDTAATAMARADRAMYAGKAERKRA